MKKFFEARNFTFGTNDSDIRTGEIIISENDILTKKLEGNVFVFQSPEQTNSSFYVISIPLTDLELFEVRRYIWNQDEFDLYFLAEKTEFDLLITLYYAKTNPRDNQIKISSFRNNSFVDELEKINKSNFETGAIWLIYSEFIDEIKKSIRVDEKLIEQLKQLKRHLRNELSHQLDKSEEIVQALIDRTLFIKFLEDNHIINQYFYDYYFSKTSIPENNEYGYKALLKEHDIFNINKLFYEINKLFNNVLFITPFIKEEYLTNNVLDLIYQSIKQYNWSDGQLSLFDFRFDVIPIEFISHIYEVFLEDTQLEEGIYYTPNKLAHLVIDDTIIGEGKILDPSCGSGMFLVLAFRKLLTFNPSKPEDNIYQKIEHRNLLIKNYIFGIEKENIAWRLTVFSLYLEILKGLPQNEIKEFIRHKLEINSGSPIFKHDFSKNIINQNALEVNPSILPHNLATFDFIVGNPPYFEIKSGNEEISFINNYTFESTKGKIRAKEIIGYQQISQAFMLKIKDWARKNTRFGFVLNSSNFYNEKSNNFQKFFFEQYQIENFYELSKVKEILFRKAKEGVVVAIFNNNIVKENIINYYSVNMGIFSETFDLLIIEEDKKIKLVQKDLLNEKINLRDYLIGNKLDLSLIKKIESNSTIFNDYILEDNYYGFAVGMRITGKDKLCPHLNISEAYYNSLTKRQQNELIKLYKKEKSSLERNSEFSIPYIEYNDIYPYKAIKNIFISRSDIENGIFRRNKKIDFYENRKILFRRMPLTIDYKYFFPVYLSTETEAFSDSVFAIRIKKQEYEYLLIALLNSDLINYYLNIGHVKRSGGSHPKIDKSDIKKIPIPTKLDKNLVSKISEISSLISEGEIEFNDTIKDTLNSLICDLYELNFLDINRIKDFFSIRKKVTSMELDKYCDSLGKTLEFYFESKPTIEYFQGVNLPFGLIITAIYFYKNEKNQVDPNIQLQCVINEILENTGEKFLAMREKVYGNNCIYIVKDNSNKSWSTTKAFEDGQDILNRLAK